MIWCGNRNLNAVKSALNALGVQGLDKCLDHGMEGRLLIELRNSLSSNQLLYKSDPIQQTINQLIYKSYPIQQTINQLMYKSYPIQQTIN